MPAVMPPNGSSRSGTITHYESQTVYRLTRYINAVNTGYGGCGEAIHTHKHKHAHTHTQSISERKGGSDCKNRPWAVFSQTGSLTNTRATEDHELEGWKTNNTVLTRPCNERFLASFLCSLERYCAGLYFESISSLNAFLSKSPYRPYQ